MHEKITVWAWVEMEIIPVWTWKLCHGGNSIIKAVYYAWRARAFFGICKNRMETKNMSRHTYYNASYRKFGRATLGCTGALILFCSLCCLISFLVF